MEEMCLYHAKMKVAKSRSLGPYRPLKPTGAGPSALPPLPSAIQQNRVSRDLSGTHESAKQACLRQADADQQWPFKGTESEMVTVRDMQTVLEQLARGRAGGPFSRGVGRGLFLSRLKVFPSLGPPPSQQSQSHVQLPSQRPVATVGLSAPTNRSWTGPNPPPVNYRRDSGGNYQQ